MDGLLAPWNTIRSACSALGELVFPPSCVACGSEIAESDAATPPGTDQSKHAASSKIPICRACLTEIFRPMPVTCRRCAAPAPARSRQSCVRCAGRGLRFNSAWALGLYEGALLSAVLATKAHSGEPLARALGQCMGQRLSKINRYSRLDLVVCIPADPWRRMVRGTDNARVMATAVAAGLGLPLAADVLQLTRKLRRQHDLMPAYRFQNVRGAYRNNRAYDIEGARILVVDDILTTGATASAAATTLLAGGASAVHVAVAARADGGTWT